ncbi:hypothetical protein B0H13DRAFT_2275546 [Mycena leptocephala]|nr:hypothetical protein B0H13DRAFT_2275546 [Mycena leptocephala]
MTEEREGNAMATRRGVGASTGVSKKAAGRREVQREQERLVAHVCWRGRRSGHQELEDHAAVVGMILRVVVARPKDVVDLEHNEPELGVGEELAAPPIHQELRLDLISNPADVHRGIFLGAVDGGKVGVGVGVDGSWCVNFWHTSEKRQPSSLGSSSAFVCFYLRWWSALSASAAKVTIADGGLSSPSKPKEAEIIATSQSLYKVLRVPPEADSLWDREWT